MDRHPAIEAGRTAVITGAASGIGLAAAERLSSLGMNVVMADINRDMLSTEAERLNSQNKSGGQILAVTTDVSRISELESLRDTVLEKFGDVAVLMNNAAIEQSGKALEASDTWERILSINLMGVIHGTQAFAPSMIAGGRPGAIINTGSKQGITSPPGNAAYNVAKAGVKSFSEQVAHELRNSANSQISAHLLIPGFTFTGFTLVNYSEKPDDAWWPSEVIDLMMTSIAAGDFYILCPDNAVTRDMDEKRMAWAMGDVIKNRPALSRWHPDFEDAFAAY
ncbi:MAG: SDR family NAD(P)-dependent oxidoreductase, partial [Alphaproteobacteria bacterium]